MLTIIRAGLAPDFVPYERGWQLQRDLHARVSRGEAPDSLVLLEHEPVYTAGTRTTPSERPTDGAPVIDVDRGGKITWHGPGQLIGYPIVRLPQPIDGVAYVRRLEGALARVLAERGIESRSIRGRTGVWVDTPGGVAKVAAIGVRVAAGVSMHGFALNCSNSLDPFADIVPCGIRDAGVTTLSAIAGAVITPADVVDAVAEEFRHAFEGTAERALQEVGA